MRYLILTSVFLIALSFGFYQAGGDDVEGKLLPRATISRESSSAKVSAKAPSTYAYGFYQGLDLSTATKDRSRARPRGVYIPSATPEPTATPTALPYSFYDAGPAAYYSSGWTWEDWMGFYENQVAWGNGAGPPTYDNHWCVHANIDLVGIQLLLYSGGLWITCTTGDTVQRAHKVDWRQKWGIELSWTLWNKLPDPSYVEVYIWN